MGKWLTPIRWAQFHNVRNYLYTNWHFVAEYLGPDSHVVPGILDNQRTTRTGNKQPFCSKAPTTAWQSQRICSLFMVVECVLLQLQMRRMVWNNTEANEFIEIIVAVPFCNKCLWPGRRTNSITSPSLSCCDVALTEWKSGLVCPSPNCCIMSLSYLLWCDDK